VTGRSGTHAVKAHHYLKFIIIRNTVTLVVSNVFENIYIKYLQALYMTNTKISHNYNLLLLKTSFNYQWTIVLNVIRLLAWWFLRLFYFLLKQ